MVDIDVYTKMVPDSFKWQLQAVLTAFKRTSRGLTRQQSPQDQDCQALIQGPRGRRNNAQGRDLHLRCHSAGSRRCSCCPPPLKKSIWVNTETALRHTSWEQTACHSEWWQPYQMDHGPQLWGRAAMRKMLPPLWGAHPLPSLLPQAGRSLQLRLYWLSLPPAQSYRWQKGVVRGLRADED